MTKAARLSLSIQASTIWSAMAIRFAQSARRRSDLNEFTPMLLFSGTGVLVSLVAVIFDAQGAWY